MHNTVSYKTLVATVKTSALRLSATYNMYMTSFQYAETRTWQRPSPIELNLPQTGIRRPIPCPLGINPTRRKTSMPKTEHPPENCTKENKKDTPIRAQY